MTFSRSVGALDEFPVPLDLPHDAGRCGFLQHAKDNGPSRHAGHRRPVRWILLPRNRFLRDDVLHLHLLPAHHDGENTFYRVHTARAKYVT